MEALQELLHEHGLGSHQAVFSRLRYYDVKDLASLSDVARDILCDALIDDGADKAASRTLLSKLRSVPSRAPQQPNEDHIHFYGLSDRVNRTDVSGLEESTVLKVDVDPLSEDLDRMHVPTSVLCRLIQTSSTDPMPVIWLLGPTGAGKSFLASTFLQSRDGILPVVASPDQHVPTSAHVCVHKGAIHSGSSRSKPVLLFDLEGEDGRVPKTLLEVGMRKLNVLRMAGLTEDALKEQLANTTARRQAVIKERLPPLAYLLSDVVVFIDTVEPRRTERADRIRRFAKQAHQAVASLAWKPALILVQNKWVGESDRATFNVSKELEWLLEGLEGIFSSVSVLRLAHSTQRHLFEASVNEFHDELVRMVQEVQDFRQEQGVLYSEREFWFSFKPMVTQFGRPAPTASVCSSLAHFVSRDCVLSRDAADNAPWAFDMLTAKARKDQPMDPHQFQETLRQVLRWYAYSQAAEARRDGADLEFSKQTFRVTCERVISLLKGQEPCSAHLPHDDGKAYPCTQLCTGHLDWHRNPAMLPVPSQNLVKRAVSFGLWKDRKPCTWRGPFEPSFVVARVLAELEQEFVDCVSQDGLAYLNAFPCAGEFEEKQLRAQADSSDGICWLCLRVDSEQVRLKHDLCRHALCRRCVITRMMLLGPENTEIVCPFCKLKSEGQFQSGHGDNGLRLLSLDGGGVRGIIEVLVLKHLEDVC